MTSDPDNLALHQPYHGNDAKRVLWYLVATPSHGIYFSGNNIMSLHTFSDGDWTWDSDDYVSTNAHIVYFGKWRSVANTSAEIRWICNLLSELRITLRAPPVTYCDNLGATFFCANPVFYSRMKHVSLDYHFIKGQVQTWDAQNCKHQHKRSARRCLN